MAMNEQILASIDPAEPVALTQQLIRIPSFLWHESTLGHWIADWMRARGFAVDLQVVPLPHLANHPTGVTHQAIGVLRGDGSAPSLMLCGHTDTSDWQGRPFREGEWKHDPFGGEIEDGKLYGLGALNMKAGVAAILCAADALRRADLPRRGDLIVACVVAETGGGVGAVHLIEQGLRPDFCIVTEAGNLDMGLISVGYVQGKVRLIGEFKHRVPYNNPIEQAAKVIQAFGPAYQPIPAGSWLRYTPHPLLPGFPRMAVRAIEHFQDTTTLTFDLRTIPGMTEESVREDLTGLLDGLAAADSSMRYELVIPQSAQQPNMPAQPATAADSLLAAALLRSHRRVAGVDPVVGAGHRIGATADTCHFKGAGIECVEYGPGFIPVWPMVDECIDVDQIITATRVLALTAAEIVG